MLPGASLVYWIRELQQAFGCKVLVSLVIIQGILKGVCGGGGSAGLAGVPIEFLLRDFGTEAASLQVYKAAVLIPWSIKPLMGLCSDALPIAGYHRLPYLAVVAIAGSMAYATIHLAPGVPLTALLLLLFLVFFQIAMSDLLSEAVYSARLRETPARGPDLISFVWGTIGIGKLCGVAIVGLLITHFGPRGPYAVCFFLASSALAVPALNLVEEPLGERCCARVQGEDLPLALVALITGTGALALALLSVLGGTLHTKVIAAGLLAALCLGLISFVISPVVAKVNAFFFIQHLCSWSVDGAAFYFFTDGERQYPEGPHFSTVFYTSVLGLVSTAFSLVGMFAYTRWMRHWRYPRVLVVGNVLSSMVSLVSCSVFLRWNVLLGIDDHLFVLASGAVQTVVFELAWLPGMLIISQLCPSGREATMFALLAGMGNLGMSLGGYFGAFLLHMLGVEPRGAEGESAQFDRLWLAALVSAVGPCLPLCLVHTLVPGVSQGERIEGLVSATSNSLLSRMQRSRQGCVLAPPSPQSPELTTAVAVEFRSMVGRSVEDDDEV